MPCIKKCSTRKIGFSGSQLSMWNKNRCSEYSKMVQMRFPRKKHAKVFTTDSAGMRDRYAIGNAGLSMKLGRGPVNWKRVRRNKYTVIGAQNIGTTYHSVRVHIYWT